jgi:hypothetical protein
MTDDSPSEWTLGFWDGPTPGDLVEFLEYQRIIEEARGIRLPWCVFMSDRMWAILRALGY